MKDKDGFVLFSSMIEGAEPIKTIYLLLPTLHLAQQQKIGLIQEKFFGDIILYRIPEAQEEGNGRKPQIKQAKSQLQNIAKVQEMHVASVAGGKANPKVA
ncbi:MAG TPA: hypothetical protein PLO51_03290, partial [Candidatus Micrarchaeota archaeon]|nr:hypothetical protein [Candidatus Micrarchaeota archaeon]